MHFVDGLPVRMEVAPNIFDDLAMLRRLEQEPGPLQPLQARDIKSARAKLSEYRTIVTSPMTSDEMRDRAISDSGALSEVLADLTGIRLLKILTLARDSLTCAAEVSTANMTAEEQALYVDVVDRIARYYKEGGYQMTKDGMEIRAVRA